MKILIFSDSHGQTENMIQIAKEVKPDAMIHLGDHWDDGTELTRSLPAIPFYQVLGNCDYFSWGPHTQEKITPVFEGIRFLAVHGHRENVKFTLLPLRFAAMEAGARVALFGHTHSAYTEDDCGILFFNPGSCRGYGGTYGIIEINNGQLSCKICPCRK